MFPSARVSVKAVQCCVLWCRLFLLSRSSEMNHFNVFPRIWTFETQLSKTVSNYICVWSLTAVFNTAVALGEAGIMTAKTTFTTSLKPSSITYTAEDVFVKYVVSSEHCQTDSASRVTIWNREARPSTATSKQKPYVLSSFRHWKPLVVLMSTAASHSRRS